jgi:hypothetical protein
MVLKGVESESVDCNELDEDRMKWRHFLSTVMKMRVQQRQGIYSAVE